MDEIVWEERYNTGIEEIDRQHRTLVGMINKLGQAKKGQGDRKTIQDVIEELSQYTVSHFAFEEDLMETSGYRYLKPHQNIHKTFIKKVEGFSNRFQAGDDIVEEFHSLLRSWLLQHIQNDDAKGYGIEVKDEMIRVIGSTTTDKKGNRNSWLKRKLSKFFG